jgi:hypothetical protein
MMKRFTTLAAFVAAMGILVPATASAKTVAGRVASFSPTSISVFDKEVVTVGIDSQTTFTKLITQKPWQESAALTVNALRVGRYAVVHVPDGKGAAANWIQVATDVPVISNAPIAALALEVTTGYTVEAAKHLAEAKLRRAEPTASESKRSGGVDTALHCERLAELGRTAVAAGSPTSATPANSEAAIHRAEAVARRAVPNASESKRPGSPDTALHCDRMADQLEKAANK